MTCRSCLRQLVTWYTFARFGGCRSHYVIFTICEYWICGAVNYRVFPHGMSKLINLMKLKTEGQRISMVNMRVNVMFPHDHNILHRGLQRNNSLVWAFWEHLDAPLPDAIKNPRPTPLYCKTSDRPLVIDWRSISQQIMKQKIRGPPFWVYTIAGTEFYLSKKKARHHHSQLQ